MWHQHFKQIDSTQIHLRHNLALYQQKAPAILISTTRQDNGIGQYGHHWSGFTNALKFSCTIAPVWVPKTTLPLSIILGLGIITYLQKLKVKGLTLKWPNDIILGPHKCGGILVEQHRATYIVGLGLNWGRILPEENTVFAQSKNYIPLPAGPIFAQQDLGPDDFKTLPAQIYTYWLDFLKNNTTAFTTHLPTTLQNAPWWRKGQMVQVALPENKTIQGIFNGITPDGAAIINQDKIYSGSLMLPYNEQKHA